MQKKSFNTKVIALLLCLILTLSMAFGLTGCTKDSTDSQSGTNVTQTLTGGVIGEGQTQFALVVVDAEGNETNFEVHTDETTVGDALLANNLIAGEEGSYGLYVKTVNGITADYDKDQTCWAFYIDGEYAMSGVDTTEIVEGSVYCLKVEK